MTGTYQVEVGVERTGTIRVDAESEEQAREQAKQQARDHPEDLHFARVFTNNVRNEAQNGGVE